MDVGSRLEACRLVALEAITPLSNVNNPDEKGGMLYMAYGILWVYMYC